MNSIWYGDARIDLIDNLGGRVERQPAGIGPAVLLMPSLQRTRPGPVLEGRQPQVDEAMRAIRTHQPIEFSAPCGYGKSTLLRHIAAHAGIQLDRPGVYLVAGDDRPTDLLQRLVNAVYSADRPTKVSPADCSRLLTQAGAVVVLDDVACGTEQLVELLRALSGCGVVLGSDRSLLERYGRTTILAGLSDAAAIALLHRDLGRPLTRFEVPSVARLVAAIHGQPLQLRQAAALVRTNEQSFAALANRAGHDPAALDRITLDGLSDVHHRVLAALALLGGALLPAELISVVSSVGDVVDALTDLRDRKLVERNEDRFGLPVCRAESYRERALSYISVGSAAREITTWLAARDPGSDAALSAASAALSLIGFAAERRDWDGVVRLVRVAQPVLTLAGRWETCRHILDLGMQGAHAIGDSASEALFAHEQGTLALCLDQPEAAERLLSQAVGLRDSAGDRAGADLSRHNLSQLAGPPLPLIEEKKPASRDSGTRRRQPQRAIALASALLGLLAGVVVVGTGVAALTRPTSSPPSATGPTVTAGTAHTTGPPATSDHPTGPTSSTSTVTPADLRPPVVEPASQAFTRLNITPGHPIVSQMFTASNPNDRAVTMAAAQVTGDAAFVVDQDGCSSRRLQPGAQCQVAIVFDPKEIGDHTGALVVSDTDGRSSEAALSGTGFAILRVTITGGAGTVTDNNGLISCPSVCEVKIASADQRMITLTATPVPDGTPFVRWEGGCGETSTCDIDMTKDISITAEFWWIIL